MFKVLEDDGWAEVFTFAGEKNEEAPWIYSGPLVTPVPGSTVPDTHFGREAVELIQHIELGCNDSEDWIICGRLIDGRWFMLRAGCDYTGWGCRDWGSADVAGSYAEIVLLGMTDDERRRFGIQLPEGVITQ